NISYLYFCKAEDVIRDRNVTGVQTCALPILRKRTSAESSVYGNGSGQKERRHARSCFSEKNISHIHLSFCRIIRPFCKKASRPRSEERRVGKESKCHEAQY